MCEQHVRLDMCVTSQGKFNPLKVTSLVYEPTKFGAHNISNSISNNMASTSEKVSTTSQAASARVHEMVSIVREYATKYSEAAPQGELLNEIKTDLTAAADKVSQ